MFAPRSVTVSLTSMLQFNTYKKLVAEPVVEASEVAADMEDNGIYAQDLCLGWFF